MSEAKSSTQNYVEADGADATIRDIAKNVQDLAESINYGFYSGTGHGSVSHYFIILSKETSEDRASQAASIDSEYLRSSSIDELRLLQYRFTNATGSYHTISMEYKNLSAGIKAIGAEIVRRVAEQQTDADH
jgi:hypothetical protein